MKLNSGLGLLFLLSCSAFAANTGPMAPLQPTTGPGGSGILFSAKQTGPYTVPGHTAGTGYDYYLYTPLGITPGPTNPNPLPTPASAPIVLFIHGYDGNTPQPYLFWMAQMAEMGFTVIWPEYDSVPTQGLNPFLTAIAVSFTDAVAKLTATTGLVPPMLDGNSKVIYTAMGHSLGGDLAVGIASAYQKYAIPSPRAVFAIESGQGTITGNVNAVSINPAVMMVFVVADGDIPGHTCPNVKYWTQGRMSPLFKQFLLARTDTHGTPQQLMNHWFPLTYTLQDDVRPYSVDDRDYNITWKFGVALSNCSVYGTQCDYVFGNGPLLPDGNTTQTDMGVWSDGQVVTPLLSIPDPTTYFADPPNNCIQPPS